MQNNETKFPPEDSLKQRHENVDPKLRNPLLVAGLTLLMMALCLVAAGWLAKHFSQRRPVHRTDALGEITTTNLQSLQRFPAPNLAVNPRDELLEMKKQDDEKLNSYGWLDRTNGVVRIPIARAMELVLQRGLPTRTNFISETNSALRLVSGKEGSE